jgi:DDE superfamily endonuclease
MVILKSATIVDRWVADSLPGNYILANSESGYTNDDLNLQWLHHFERITRNSTRGGWRLLILDGFISHFKPSFVLYAGEHNIILYGLPPHTSHLLQPLDVVCFQPYKHYHAEAIDDAVRTGDTRFSKIEFLHALHGIRMQTFKAATVISAFRKCGIVPYNPIIVTDGLWEAQRKEDCALGIQQQTPEPSEARQQWSCTPTPRALRSYGADLLTEMEDITGPCYLEAMGKFLKGVEQLSDLYEVLKQDLSRTEQAQMARKAREERPRRRVTGGGVISVEEAREKIRTKEEELANLATRKRLREEKKSARDAAASRVQDPLRNGPEIDESVE